MIWRCGRFAFDLTKPIIVGILNITPDSFSDGGENYNQKIAYARAQQMLSEGATIIEIGGESTRPGSDEVLVAEELARVLPITKQLCAEGAAVSIDTRHAQVALHCLDAGAVIVNDVSGFRDPKMCGLVASSDVGCVVMHMLGEPKSMQDDPQYDDVVAEVTDYLLNQAERLKALGVAPDRICLDPGPGFGKSFEHNLALLKATSAMSTLGYPLMTAFSRKRFIGDITGITIAAERALPSAIVAAWAASEGARVLRVHDVRETVEALSVVRHLKESDQVDGG